MGMKEVKSIAEETIEAQHPVDQSPETISPLHNNDGYVGIANCGS